MQTYLLLFRGINVGGKNKVPMNALRAHLEGLGFENVLTYIASGNAILSSTMSAKTIRNAVEKSLPNTFQLDRKLVKVLVLSPAYLANVIKHKPPKFGSRPDTYHSDAIFLIDIDETEAMKVFRPRDGVDKVWPGDGIIYSERLSAERTKSRLSSIIGKSVYKSMTIRSWNTTVKLHSLLQEHQKLNR